MDPVPKSALLDELTIWSRTVLVTLRPLGFEVLFACWSLALRPACLAVQIAGMTCNCS